MMEKGAKANAQGTHIYQEAHFNRPFNRFLGHAQVKYFMSLKNQDGMVRLAVMIPKNLS